MSDHKDKFTEIKEKRDVINDVSPTFCLAKWLQSTVLLYNGETHSCHHPTRHKIDPEGLKTNPKGLHNTVIKIHAREDMIAGKQTKECDYCWNIENLGNDYISDRSYKSSYSWAWPHLEEVKASGTGADIDPTYLEVAFENTCNFKCLYCSPESSSRWQEEATVHGPIKLTNTYLHDIKWMKSIGKLPIHRDEPNPYIDAFWQWWPTLYQKLHTFRITGGEPLLSKHTWAVLDYIKANPRKDLTLAINTNMNVPRKLIDKLVEYVKDIAPNVKAFDIYTSAESTGSQAEYARSGMVYEEFKANCEYFLQSSPNNSHLHFMTTVNLMSAPTFKNFLEQMAEWRKQYVVSKHEYRVRFMITYLRWPQVLSLNVLSKTDREKYAKDWISYITAGVIDEKKRDDATFYVEELDQIKRMCEFMLESQPENDVVYDDFRTFITTCDERRHTSFDETFPELAYMMDPYYYG